MPGFNLGQTFFGFKPEDRVTNHENIFNLIWFGDGRWNWNDVYHMPIFLRNFWIEQCNQITSKRKQAEKRALERAKNRQNNDPTKRRR